MPPGATAFADANFTEHPTPPDRLYPDADWDRLRRLRASIDPHDVMLAVHPIPHP